MRLLASPRLQAPALVSLALAGAAALGALYALSAYGASPILLPLAMLGVVALALGLWRLEYGLALLIVATPFTENASIGDPGQAPMRLALVLWALVLVGVQAARLALSSEEEHLRVPPLLGGVAAYLGASVLAVPGAADPASAIAKLLLLGGAVVVYLLIALFLADWRRLRPVLLALLAVGLLVSGHAIYQQLTGQVSRIGYISTNGDVEFRVTSVFPHPNQLAGFLAVLVPITIGLAAVLHTRPARLACGALFLTAIAAVAFSASRGALVGLGALPLLFLRDRRAWPVIAAGLVLVVASAPDLIEDRVAGVNALNRPEIAERIDLWDAAVQTFREEPLLGFGLDNFPRAYVELERPGRSFIGGFGVPPTAHNLYLNTLAEQGLLGAAALVALAVGFIRVLLRLASSPDPRMRAMSRALVGAGLVLALHNLFDVTFSDAKNATLAWVLLGVAAALARIDAEAGTPLRPFARA